MGYPDGIYRVGPLARLNSSTACGTPRAEPGMGRVPRARAQRRAQLVPLPLRAADRDPVLRWSASSSCCTTPTSSTATCARYASAEQLRKAWASSEAPRGTLIHHYKIDDDGLITWANLIIATGHNNLGDEPRRPAGGAAFRARQQDEEGMLNRVEAVIRASIRA